MKSVVGLVLGISLCSMNAEGQAMTKTAQGQAEPVHVVTSFQFQVNAAYARVAPMFGPESEKSWAGPQWQPTFLYPLPGKDVHGAVFTVPHGPHKSIWVNTAYDVQGGRMQYVAMIPGVVVSVIDVRVKEVSSSRTAVDVTYTRTALDADANEDVRMLARHDGQGGPEWKASIEQALKSAAAPK